MSGSVNVGSEIGRSVEERMDSPVKSSILTDTGTEENEGASTPSTKPDDNSSLGKTKLDESEQRDNDSDVRYKNIAENLSNPPDGTDNSRVLDGGDDTVIPNTEHSVTAACEQVTESKKDVDADNTVDNKLKGEVPGSAQSNQNSSLNSSSKTQTDSGESDADRNKERWDKAGERDGDTKRYETETLPISRTTQNQSVRIPTPNSEAAAYFPQNVAETSPQSTAGDTMEVDNTAATENKSRTLQSKLSPQKTEMAPTAQEPKSKNLQSSEELVVSLPPVENATVVEVPAEAGATASCSRTSSDDKSNSACAGTPDDTNAAQSVYSVKWVMFKNTKVPIITQNENGPCPLIAIMNVLLLKKKIQFPAMMEMVTSDQLMSYLGECIFDNAPKNITEDSRLNYEQNMHDAMAVFHKLQTGLDVNVRFTGVRDFEYTTECIIFDLLEIRLYHGWMVDPQEPQDVSAVGNCSYNQLVEKIIAQKSSDKQELVTEALIAETFLESSAAQLTYHGLCELSTTVKEGELCVFFRNNHFTTLYRHKGELFLLVTDQGFLTEPNVVWETLSNVEGDCHFVDANFHTYTKPELAPIVTPDVQAGSEQQIDQDYLVALSLQQEQQLQGDPEAAAAWNNQQPVPSAPIVPLSDHEIAMRLQEEEDRRAAAAYAQQQQQQRPAAGQPSANSGGRRQRDRESREGREKEKEKDSCLIL